MKSQIFTLLLIICTLNNVFSQNTSKRHTISGYLKDSVSTENLISATVYNKATLAGTSTNQYGFYSLTLPAGDVEIVFSYVGYYTQSVSFNLKNDTIINMQLGGSVQLGEVEITANRTSRIQESTQMSSMTLPAAQIKTLPAFLGEVDVLKVLQLMPGIQSGGEGTSGLYVRGGGPDQNLILLDGVPLYNVSHLFGFFSVFNADAINSMEIIKGGFPARYGGRVSSVLDINMKEGNMQKFGGEGSVGIVAAKLTLEGPIIKDRTSFILSGRRTYIDVLAAPFIAMVNNMDSDVKIRAGYYFYDMNAKINHRISAKDRIYLSAYMGDDKFYAKGWYKNEYSDYDVEYKEDEKMESGLKWGNITTAFRWNHIYTNKLFGNTTITYSRYRFNTGARFESRVTEDGYRDFYFADIQYNSGINDWSGKVSFDYIPSPDHYIRLGANAIYHTFNPGVIALRDNDLKTDFGGKERYAWEYAAYIEDDIKITPLLKTNVGFHWSAFSIDGKFYNFLQPRISARYLINSDLSAKAAISRMAQYVHLITNSNIGLPTDLWVPSTPLLHPQTSNQAAVGLAQNFRENYEISLEVYYKTMDNVLEYKEGASFFDVGDTWEDKIVQGEGQSYGLELFAQKKTGSFTGWVGYTLSWTDRQFEELNQGKPFYYKYDRRHDISLALMKRFNQRIEASGAWIFGTGNCITVPIGIYYPENPLSNDYSYYGEKYEFSERNSYRMAPYHRLDLSVSFIKQKRWGERRWVWSIFNAYNRKNPFYIDVRESYHPRGRKYKFVQFSLFPIIPSVSYSFKF